MAVGGHVPIEPDPADGIERVAVSTGDPRNAVVTSDGASSMESSRLTPTAVAIIRHFQGVAKKPSGDPLASVELMTAQAIPRAGASENDPSEARYTSIRGVTPIALDQDGVDVAAVRADAARARLGYITPSHQFPTGCTLSLDRRLELLAWAESTGAWLIEDD